MLVLTRRESEKVLFPSLGISVEVIKVQGRKTRLGIKAPAEIPILRNECEIRERHLKPAAAGNKTLDCITDVVKSNQQLSELIQVIQSRLNEAATKLEQLNKSVDNDAELASQRLMADLFADMQSLETQANQVLSQSGVLINNPPQALLVEDGACERKLLEAFLELCGFEVVVARDGQDALDYLSLHGQPDVVLLDMMMPRMNGPSFVHEVRAKHELDGLSIFAVSGKSQAEIEERFGTVQVDRWFEKPISPKGLVHEIAEHLTNKALVA